MGDRAKILAVVVIFITLISGGVLLTVLDNAVIGSNMITAGIGFVTGAGVMIINGAEERKRRESLLPPFGRPNGKGRPDAR